MRFSIASAPSRGPPSRAPARVGDPRETARALRRARARARRRVSIPSRARAGRRAGDARPRRDISRRRKRASADARKRSRCPRRCAAPRARRSARERCERDAIARRATGRGGDAKNRARDARERATAVRDRARRAKDIARSNDGTGGRARGATRASGDGDRSRVWCGVCDAATRRRGDAEDVGSRAGGEKTIGRMRRERMRTDERARGLGFRRRRRARCE